MRKVVLIDKGGAVITKNVKNCTTETLYKKCKCRTNQHFERWHTWPHGDKYVSLYARDDGRANTENKYDLPPPLDTVLYFGTMVCVGHSKEVINNEELVDITKEDWLAVYEKLFGGFEDWNSEMESSEDELENIDPDLKTTSGYLKDGFVVNDDALDDEDENYVVNSNEDSNGCDDSEDEEAYYGKDTDDEEGYSTGETSDNDVAVDDDEGGGDNEKAGDDADKESEQEGGESDSELSEEEYSYK